MSSYTIKKIEKKRKKQTAKILKMSAAVEC